MKRSLFFLVVIGAAVIIVGCGTSQSAKTQSNSEKVISQNSETNLIAQKTCPVMGNSINKSLFVDYNGKRIYVCCGMCIGQVKNNPEKYIEKLKEMGEEPVVI